MCVRGGGGEGGEGVCCLGGVSGHLFVGEQSKSTDITMGTETVTVSENFFLDMIKRLRINVIFYTHEPIQYICFCFILCLCVR